MQYPWIAHYEEGVPAEIDPDIYPSVVAMFEQAVEKFPDHPAFECFGVSLSFSELDVSSRAVAAYLQNEFGIKRGDRVAVMTPNFLGFPIAMLGLMRAGGVQVNVNPLYTPLELSYQLNDASVDTIIIFAGSTPVLAEIIDETQVKRIITINPADGSGLDLPAPPVDERLSGTITLVNVIEKGASMAFNRVELAGDDILFFQYTGGTTGLSKGAVLNHRNIVANARQFGCFLPAATRPGEEIVVGALPLYHIFGLILCICYMSIGGKMLLIPNPRDMDSFVAALMNSRFSIIAGVNTLFSGLLQHPDFKNVDFSNYKFAIGGGSAVIEATSNQWQKVTGKPIKEGYGLSETSPILTSNPMAGNTFSGFCGLPVPSTEIILLDEEENRVPQGSAGEICAKGPQVMQGYWNKPEANKQAFTADGFFKTGDIGIFDERGYVKIVDRKKDMIIVSGFNVFPNEIEAMIASCPGVLESACIGVTDERTGEAVRAFVVKTAGADLTQQEVVDHCRQGLTAYKVPKQIVFIDALPKSNVGKILRRELRNL